MPEPRPGSRKIVLTPQASDELYLYPWNKLSGSSVNWLLNFRPCSPLSSEFPVVFCRLEGAARYHIMTSAAWTQFFLN
jgi:hypothetical protein